MGFLLMLFLSPMANVQTKGLADLANHRALPNDTLQIEIALAELRQGLQASICCTLKPYLTSPDMRNRTSVCRSRSQSPVWSAFPEHWDGKDHQGSLGRQITTLIEATKVAGAYRVLWDGRNDRGDEVESGIYFYRMESGDFVATRKISLLP